jgi:hypothetical protein
MKARLNAQKLTPKQQGRKTLKKMSRHETSKRNQGKTKYLNQPGLTC